MFGRVQGVFAVECKRETPVRQLDHGNSKRPHVRLDTILIALDPFGLGSAGGTYTHIGARADKGIRNRVDQLARYAKVAQLHLAVLVHENIARLDVWVRGQKTYLGG